jgi:hypothetical protein
MSDTHAIIPFHKLGPKFVLACILIGLAARWLIWFFFYDQFNADLSDQERYLAEAHSLLHNGVFALAPGQPPTAFDGPVYASFLALVIKIFKYDFFATFF